MTGRYLQPEPLLLRPEFAVFQAQRGRSTESYAYAQNNPIRHTDQTGLSTDDRECSSQRVDDIVREYTAAYPDLCERCRKAREITKVVCESTPQWAACHCSIKAKDKICSFAMTICPDTQLPVGCFPPQLREPNDPLLQLLGGQ